MRNVEERLTPTYLGRTIAYTIRLLQRVTRRREDWKYWHKRDMSGLDNMEGGPADEAAENNAIQTLLDQADVEIDKIGEQLSSNQAQLQHEKAVALYQQALNLAEKDRGNDDPDTVTIRELLVASLRDAGEISQAIMHGTHNVRVYRKVHGPRSSVTLDAQRRLAECYVENDRVVDAIRLYEEIMAMAAEDLPLVVCQDRSNLASALYASGTDRHIHRAVDLNIETLHLAEQNLGPSHIETCKVRSQLGTELFKLSKHQDAIIYYRSNIEALHNREGEGSTSLSTAERQRYLEDSEASLAACLTKIAEDEEKKKQKLKGPKRLENSISDAVDQPQLLPNVEVERALELEPTKLGLDDTTSEETSRTRIVGQKSTNKIPLCIGPGESHVSSGERSTLSKMNHGGHPASNSTRGRSHSTELQQADLGITSSAIAPKRSRSVCNMTGCMNGDRRALEQARARHQPLKPFEDGQESSELNGTDCDFPRVKRVDSVVVERPESAVKELSLQEGLRTDGHTRVDAEINMPSSGSTSYSSASTPSHVLKAPLQGSVEQETNASSNLGTPGGSGTCSDVEITKEERFQSNSRGRKPGRQSEEASEGAFASDKPANPTPSPGHHVADPLATVPKIRVDSSDESEGTRTMPGEWPRESRRRARSLAPRQDTLLSPATLTTKQRRASSAGLPQEYTSWTSPE